MKKEDQFKKIEQALRKAVADAIARHKLLGQSIAIWKNGKVIIVPANKIKVPALAKKKTIQRKLK